MTKKLSAMKIRTKLAFLIVLTGFFCYSLFQFLWYNKYTVFEALDPVFHYHWVYCDADFNLGRPGIRLAFSGLHYVFCGRNSTSLYRNRGAVLIKNLFGNKAQTNLYFKRKQRRRT